MIHSLRKIYRRYKKKWRFFKSVNWIKTIYFNYKKFPYSIAKKLPVVFYGRVRFNSIKGNVILEAPIKKAMIGFGQRYEAITKAKGTAELFLEGTFVFKGHVQFGIDYFIHIAENAYCEFGHMSSIASSGKIICKDKIVLGTYSRIGSESQLIDTNFHQMIDTLTGEKFKMTSPINVGNFNFISNRVSIMQKTVTPNNCTIASNTLCNKDYRSLGENILIGGIPAKLLKENISRDWKGEKEKLEDVLIVR
jgi:acetyltransferase-like isoleucine patch superfamily enzyme